MMQLDSRTPTGPLEGRWDKTRFEMKLVNPANKRKYEVIVVGTGLAGGSAAATLGQSIAADVLDLDELRSRQSRAGLLLAFWAMGGKLADAVGGFLALMILASFGFSPQTMANAPDAVWGLTLTYIVMPWPFYFVSILLLWNFPITRERQARIRRLVERRALRIQAAMPSPAQ